MQNAIYQEVTDKIIQELESGTAPWVKPWTSDNSADRNIVSKNEYNGINRLILSMTSHFSGHNLPYWGSFKQWDQLGANVKKVRKELKSFSILQ